MKKNIYIYNFNALCICWYFVANISTNNVGCEKMEESNLVNRDRRKDGRRKKGEGRRTSRKYVNYMYLS